MKSVDIAAAYGLDVNDFEQFLVESKAPYSQGLLFYSLDDADVEKYVNLYLQSIEDEEEAERIEAEEQKRKMKAMSEMLISSGFSFEGYSIVKYSGYISGDDSVEIPRGTDRNHGSDICAALVKIRRQALAELKGAAYELGCNAVIGVDFDYITLEPETSTILLKGHTIYEPYVICVTANGNAVVIEKNKSQQRLNRVPEEEL